MSLGFPVSLARFGHMGHWPQSLVPPTPPPPPIDTTWADEYVLSAGDMPYLIMFATDGTFNGIVGVLIDYNLVMLSADAVDFLAATAATASVVTGHVGGVLTDFSDQEAQDEPKSYVTHEGWIPATGANNLGVVLFSGAFTPSLYTNIIGYTDVSEASYVEPTTQATAGGLKFVGGSITVQANLTVSVQARASLAVANSWGLPFTVTSSMIPMEDSDTSIYTGFGAPLLAWNGSGDYLTGVNAYPGDATVDFACVYTRISQFVPWIEFNTGISPNPGL